MVTINQSRDPLCPCGALSAGRSSGPGTRSPLSPRGRQGGVLTRDARRYVPLSAGSARVRPGRVN